MADHAADCAHLEHECTCGLTERLRHEDCDRLWRYVRELDDDEVLLIGRALEQEKCRRGMKS